ncbi:MAG: glycosyltransferase family 2 protein [Candidatus Pacearchaeota archaeon]|jgi:GT2 family glycosyltransferase
MDLLSKKQPKVAIIITTFNQKDLLKKCLKSLENKTNYENYMVYVVDDSGNGKIGKTMKNSFNWINVIINNKNLGFSKANNIGIRKSLKEYNPDYILLLNDDTEIIQVDWLKNMVLAGEKDKKTGILGCKIVYPDGSLQNIGGYIRKWEIVKELKDRNDIFEVDHVMGSCLLIKREVIEKIGVLDEVFSPYLLEDTDYCLRAKKTGFLIKSVGSVKIIHKKGKTIDSLKDKKALFIRFKNDIIFSFRHLKFKYALFRVFVYLPLVAVLKKKKDEDNLEFRNFVVRKDFIINFGFYSISLVYTPLKVMLR